MPHGSRTLLLGVALGVAGASSSCAGQAVDATPLTFGRTVEGHLQSGGSHQDFYVLAADDTHGISFEVEVNTNVAGGVSMYVLDAALNGVTCSNMESSTPDGAFPAAEGHRVPYATGGALHPAGVPFTEALQANALDSMPSSRIYKEDYKTLQFYGYISPCYILPGNFYFVRLYGNTVLTTAVGFRLTAYATEASITLAQSGSGSTTGSVCDGKWVHHYFDYHGVQDPADGVWDYTAVAGSGHLKIEVKKESGELHDFFVRKESCSTGQDGETNAVGSKNLRGFGRTTQSLTLGTAKAGRYYVSLRGEVDLCGQYSINVHNVSAAESHA